MICFMNLLYCHFIICSYVLEKCVFSYCEVHGPRYVQQIKLVDYVLQIVPTCKNISRMSRINSHDWAFWSVISWNSCLSTETQSSSLHSKKCSEVGKNLESLTFSLVDVFWTIKYINSGGKLWSQSSLLSNCAFQKWWSWI